MDYDVVRTSVSTAYNNYKKNDSKFYNSMDNFYKVGKENPTVARIILQDQIRKGVESARQMLSDVSRLPTQGIMEPQTRDATLGMYGFAVSSAQRSISAIDIYNETAYIDDPDCHNFRATYLGLESRREFDESWNKKYPKTGQLRERIIENDRISMDKVNPKAGWFEKINFVKTLKEYKKDYPKTFNVRYALIMQNQITEEKVTPRVKNWFRRIAYKTLIKNGFKFKI